MTHSLGPTPPTIGRIVHIEHETFGVVPAIVTQVLDGDAIKATMFLPDNPPWCGVIAEHVEPGGKPKSRARHAWHWPPIR